VRACIIARIVKNAHQLGQMLGQKPTPFPSKIKTGVSLPLSVSN